MNMDLAKEFNRQVANLISKGYPKIANLTEEEFTKFLSPLKDKLNELNLPEIDIEIGILPFVIVVKNELIDSEKAMSLVEREGKIGTIKLYPHQAADFKPIEDANIPGDKIYLLADLDRGKENINIRPSDAFKMIHESNRLPLTIDEGIAIVTQFPKFLKKNNCFSLLASRVPGNQRVPAIWISAEKRPNLGWCWDGNPHTWLGSASARIRIGTSA